MKELSAAFGVILAFSIVMLGFAVACSVDGEAPPPVQVHVTYRQDTFIHQCEQGAIQPVKIVDGCLVIEDKIFYQPQMWGKAEVK